MIHTSLFSFSSMFWKSFYINPWRASLLFLKVVWHSVVGCTIPLWNVPPTGHSGYLKSATNSAAISNLLWLSLGMHMSFLYDRKGITGPKSIWVYNYDEYHQIALLRTLLIYILVQCMRVSFFPYSFASRLNFWFSCKSNRWKWYFNLLCCVFLASNGAFILFIVVLVYVYLVSEIEHTLALLIYFTMNDSLVCLVFCCPFIYIFEDDSALWYKLWIIFQLII